MAFKPRPTANKHTSPNATPSAKKNYTRLDALATREYEHEGETKTAFTRIGAAFVADDGTVTVLLDAFPVSGKLLLRHPLPPRE